MSDSNPEFQKPPANKEAWDKFWKEYCKIHGHRFVNDICIYCSRPRHHIEIDEMFSDGEPFIGGG